MSAGPISTRVYNALRELVTHRGFRPGARIDPADLKDRLGSSITPIREALHSLCGEGLILAAPNGGFHMMPMDEPDLCDLYGWTTELLVLAVRRWPTGRIAPPVDAPDLDVADRTATLFRWIATQSRNLEHMRAITQANARLHGARMIEARLLPEGMAALGEMVTRCANDDRTALRRQLLHYERQRIRIAGKIVRELHRSGGDIAEI